MMWNLPMGRARKLHLETQRWQMLSQAQLCQGMKLFCSCWVTGMLTRLTGDIVFKAAFAGVVGSGWAASASEAMPATDDCER